MALETGRPFTNPSYFGNEISLRGEHSEALRLAFELIPLGVIYWSAQDLRTILGDGGGFCLGTTRTSESWPGLAARRKRCPVRRLRLRPALIWSELPVGCSDMQKDGVYTKDSSFYVVYTLRTASI